LPRQPPEKHTVSGSQEGSFVFKTNAVFILAAGLLAIAFFAWILVPRVIVPLH